VDEKTMKANKAIGKRELQLIRNEADHFVKNTDSFKLLPYQLAGTALSENGVNKLKGTLQDLYAAFHRYLEKIPDDFSYGDAAEIFGNVCAAEGAALLYIYVDTFRPQPRFSFSSSQRAQDREYQDELDMKVQFSAASLISLRKLKNALSANR
jgi:hypothetical protein